MCLQLRPRVQNYCSQYCDNLEDVYTCLAVLLIVSGLACMTVGYVVPRDYEFNPYYTAREMEGIEIYFATLSNRLDIAMTVGTGLVAAGGLVMTGVMLNSMYCKKKVVGEYEDITGTRYSEHASNQPLYGACATHLEMSGMNSQLPPLRLYEMTSR